MCRSLHGFICVLIAPFMSLHHRIYHRSPECESSLQFRTASGSPINRYSHICWQICLGSHILTTHQLLTDARHPLLGWTLSRLKSSWLTSLGNTVLWSTILCIALGLSPLVLSLVNHTLSASSVILSLRCGVRDAS